MYIQNGILQICISTLCNMLHNICVCMCVCFSLGMLSPISFCTVWKGLIRVILLEEDVTGRGL